MLLRIDTKEFHGASDSIVSINGHHFNKLKIKYIVLKLFTKILAEDIFTHITQALEKIGQT